MKYLMIMLISTTLLTACVQTTTTDETERFLMAELEQQDYEVINWAGTVTTFTLGRSFLLREPNQLNWALQDLPLSEFINKEVTSYRATVKGHYLDAVSKQADQTNLILYVVDGEWIGGLSIPDIDALGGGAHSINGETFEEVHDQPVSDWIEAFEIELDELTDF